MIFLHQSFINPIAAVLAAARRKPMLVLRGRPTTEFQAWGDLF